MNKAMSEKISSVDWYAKELPSELSKIIESGFCESDEGIFIAALRKKSTNVSKKDFPDRTGYECFVNSIHIDDFVGSNYLAYACLFVEKIFECWRSNRNAGVIQAIISSDDLGAVVKLHFLRAGEAWLDSNLETYEEGILVADSLTIRICER
jgi:hypothetical protein